MKKKIFSIILHEYCIGGRMRYLIISLCFIFYVYAQDSHTLQWQNMDCKESDNLLIRLYGFIPACMDKDCKISLCQGGLQNARKVFINSNDIADAYKQWYQQDGDMSQMLGNMPLANTTIALYKNIITPHIRYTWKDHKTLIIEEEYECNEVDNTYPIGRYIIFQQIRDKVLIIEIYNQVC